MVFHAHVPDILRADDNVKVQVMNLFQLSVMPGLNEHPSYRVYNYRKGTGKASRYGAGENKNTGIFN